MLCRVPKGARRCLAIARFEATGSPVITDGEQRKYHNFWTYSVHGLANTVPDGFKIPFGCA
jgi:5-methyltetrahydropteroyltriglutamate--homocysteine methyltransferase